MSNLNFYNISFFGLKTGENNFTYEVDNSFFKLFDNSEIKEGTLLINVSVQKENDFAVLDFKCKGNVEVMCDLCLGYFTLPIEFNSRLIAKIGKENYEDDFNDIIYFSQYNGVFNIAQFLYDNIITSLPLTKKHPIEENGKSNCDETMIKLINKNESKYNKIEDFKSDIFK